MLGRVKKTDACLKHTPSYMVAKYEQLLVLMMEELV